MSFSNSSRVDSCGNYQQIPWTNFEANRSSMDSPSKFGIISGVALIILGGIGLLGIVGTTGFYISIGNLAFGVGGILIIIVANYYRGNDEELQLLPLPQAKSLKEYHERLDTNAKNRYGLHLPDLLKYHKESTTVDLVAQSLLDLTRPMMCLLNGRPFSLEGTEFKVFISKVIQDKLLANEIIQLANSEPDAIRLRVKLSEITDRGEEISEAYLSSLAQKIQTSFPDLFQYTNQALFAEMFGILDGRYSNGDLGISLTQKPSHNLTSANSLIEIVSRDEKMYIRLRQKFCILFNGEDRDPLHLIAKLSIDVEEGTGYLTWQSPQTKEPFF